MYKKMLAKQFTKRKWLKHWAGRWHLLNNSMLGYQYTRLLEKELGAGLRAAVFISHKHYTTAYLDISYYKIFGEYLAKKVLKNHKQLIYWTNQLQKRTDNILGLIKKLKKQRKITGEDFKKFSDAFYSYGVPHRVIKIVVDALSSKKLKKFLPRLSKARIYAEPVYAETEGFIEHLTSRMAKATSYRIHDLLCITKEEMANYWENEKLPTKKVLAARFDGCAILYDCGNSELLIGKKLGQLENAIDREDDNGGRLNGFTAYPGKVKGTARIVFNPHKVKIFNVGDILVTGMTRPEYLPFIKKSSGFVTDAGGILSHAAIVARELKKPCIIGTLSATKVLKDGDFVEIDAKKGCVRIIKKLNPNEKKQKK